jgi:hypothetical protein
MAGVSFRAALISHEENSQARSCAHNVVPGEAATKFVLACLRQRVLSPTALPKLTARLRELAAAEGVEDPARRRREACEAELAAVERKLATVGRNMALAETPEERQATAAVFRELQESKARLARQLDGIRPAEGVADPEREVEAALAGLGRLHELAVVSEPEGAGLGELFRRVDARLYLRFRAEERGGRTINTPSGGVLTFGSTPPPGPLYQGPTDRAIIRRMLAAGEPVSAPSGHGAPGSSEPGPEVNWSANVQRGTSRCSGPGPPWPNTPGGPGGLPSGRRSRKRPGAHGPADASCRFATRTEDRPGHPRGSLGTALG